MDDCKEVGLFGIMHASTISKCPIPYYSQEKTFYLYNKNSISIKIVDGIGVINTKTMKKPEYECDDTDYDELFEISDEIFNGEIPEIFKTQSINIFKHLVQLTRFIYNAKVKHLEIGFGLKDGKIYLSEVISCLISNQCTCNIFSSVPDGIDMFVQFLVLCVAQETENNHCNSIRGCKNEPSIQVALGAVLGYQLRYLFFDCNTEELHYLLKTNLRNLNPNILRKTVYLCSDCYREWQLDESRYIKAVKMEQRIAAKNETKKKNVTRQSLTNAGHRIIGNCLRKSLK